MTKRTFYIETWGCQMNILDSERMAGLLKEQGYETAAGRQDADLLVLNTCDVREKAESKVYSELGRLRDWKRERPGRLIGVAGCVAQRVGMKILDNLPSVDFVLGTGNVERLAQLVDEAKKGIRQGFLDLPRDSPEYQFETISRGSTFRAYVTIIEGCDQFCTFCIVPFTRGRERSRRSAEIEAEVTRLIGQGYVEITLLGQTVNAYRCPETGLPLAGLLANLAGIQGLKRLSFITSHPAFVTPELIATIGDHPVIARYFHLPAQSGADRILFRMKRRYTKARYLQIIEEIRSRIPGIALSSDFIVGFPGETEEDFQQTLGLIEDARFSSLYAFIYSPRPGTAAFRWGDDGLVPAEVANERLGRLLDLQRAIQKQENRELEGARLRVLVEGEGKKPGFLVGRSSCNRIVHFPAGDGETAPSPGHFANVVIERAMEHSLMGHLEAAGAERW